MAHSSTVQTLGFLLLAAILLQTVAVAVTFMYFSSALATMKETFSKSSISCLRRSSLNFLKGSEADTKEDDDDPCWQVTEQLHLLIEKTMSTRYRKELSSFVSDEVSRVLPSIMVESQHIKRPELAAHLTGNVINKQEKYENSLSRGVVGQKILNWESKRGLAFLHNLHFKDGELIIPRTGLYYIYSQTYFRHSVPITGEVENLMENKQMLQYIYKVTSYPEPILLMKNARTTCWSKNSEYGLYSIYQAGAFQLKADDRVFVSVSNITIVDMDEESSFFGAFMVS
ncbi:tumor necrosis factor ligand superfamily member 10 [Polypterus senegalus]|uniref:tumor necrosis factor ligand superfamily member 10 n=1 Tax=Polypterus senegalus TaxID=55291 RepID=UPI001964387B|nr:tumor necrosis factor ligand superfamily member 10 [Polypterus senegalus]